MIDLALPVNEPEIMDSFACSKEDLEGALNFLKITNRFFGGSRVILRHLDKFSVNWNKNKKIKILDAGCGAGDLSLAVHRWAQQRGFIVQITGVEMVPQIAELARTHTQGIHGIRIVEDDVLNGPNPDRFDYVFASLFLHHIPPERQVEALQKIDSLATKGLILSDLERSHSGFYCVSLLSRLIGNKVVRHDGPLSVRRAFTLTELNFLAKASGLHYLLADRECFFRLSLAGEKPA